MILKMVQKCLVLTKTRFGPEMVLSSFGELSPFELEPCLFRELD